jgi:cytochrome P450 RapN
MAAGEPAPVSDRGYYTVSSWDPGKGESALVAARTGEIIDYPIVKEDALDVDPIYKELQALGPIKVKLPFGEPCWLATRYEDVRAVYGDRRFGRVLGLPRDSPGVWIGAVMAKDPTMLVNMDPPEHTRLRRLTTAAFSPRRIGALRGDIQAKVDDLVDQLEAQGGSVDFASAFARQLPPSVLTLILGVPVSEAQQFRSWIDDMTGFQTEPDARQAAIDSTREYVEELIARRRSAETEDLLHMLVHARDDDDRLSEEELFNLSMSVWLGGLETTVNQLGTTIYALMTHRDRWQELLDEPDLIPAALEELWRWIPSFKYGVPFVRWASEDVELSGGTLVRAGEPVLPEHAVANRDEAAFPRGWEIDFHRDQPKPHLSLAFGAHRCMGAHLANLQIQITLETLLRRLPTLDLAVPAENIMFSESTFMRSIEVLPISW